MDLGLRDRVAIVTGGSKGIGRAIAFGLAREGARVAICARGAEALEATVEEVQKATDAQVLSVQADMGRLEDIRRLVSTTVQHFGSLDILVNNAVSFPIGTFAELPDEAWQHHLNVKLLGYVRCARESVPHMQQHRWGRIVNIAGSAARQSGMIGMTAGPINAAVVNFTKALSDQVASYNITVNAIHPGATHTDRHRMNITRRARELNISLEEAEHQTIQGIPIGRLIEPEDIANMVLFLASEKASAITGQAIGVDGGAMRGVFY
ncbi:MAG: SDR family oxidoreductase [Chloroflexi bacterium]|nr:SDR family oxidoreductase [Chloroflexota bacterium]